MGNPILVRKNTQWVSGTTYTAGDVVYITSNSIQYPITCLITHIAGTFATDVTSGYWQMSVPYRNHVINGNFNFWQRSTSAAYATSYATADRIFTFRQTGSVGATASRQLASSWLDNGFIPQYCFRMQRDAGNSVTTAIEMIQAFETVNTIPLAGKVVTMSFYARAGTNFSASGNLITPYIGTGTGTDQGVVAGWTGAVVPISGNIAITTAWKRYSITGTIPANTTQLRWDIGWNPTGTAGANDYVEIAQVMINEGPVPASFQMAGNSLGGEFALCQRYYEVGTAFGNSDSSNGNIKSVNAGFSVQKRANPTLTGSVSHINGGGGSFSIASVSVNTFSISGVVNVGLGAAGYIYVGNFTADAEL